MLLRLFVFFAILIQYGFCEPQSCYFCNTEVHGQGCNDPIVPANIQVQTCSDMETVQQGSSSTFSKVLNYFTHVETNNISTRNATNSTNPTVCYSITYVFDERIISSRGCESQSRDGRWGSQTYEICDYYRLLHQNRVTNFSCNTCTDNLCNHANHRLNEPSSSGNLLISIKLMAFLLITKFYLM